MPNGFRLRGLLISLLSVSIFTISGCSPQNATGTYVGTYTNAAIALEIVQTADGRITGKLLSVTIDNAGQIQDGNAAVSGVINADHITLDLRPVAFLPFSVSLSGTRDSGSMTLHGDAAGGQISKVDLKLGNLAEFEAQAKVLRDQSQARLAAKAEAERKVELERSRQKALADISALIERMERVQTKDQEYLPKFGNVAKRYDTITTQMNSTLEQEKRARSSFDRGQLSFRIASAADFAGPTAAAHRDVESLKRDFLGIANQIETEDGALKNLCKSSPSSNSILGVAAAVEELRRACARLSDAFTMYEVSANEMRDAFDREAKQYSEAQSKQKRIVAEAQQLEKRDRGIMRMWRVRHSRRHGNAAGRLDSTPSP